MPEIQFPPRCLVRKLPGDLDRNNDSTLGIKAAHLKGAAGEDLQWVREDVNG